MLGYKTCLIQNRFSIKTGFCIFYRSYKTGFGPKRVNTKPVQIYLYIFFIIFFIFIYIYIHNIYTYICIYIYTYIYIDIYIYIEIYIYKEYIYTYIQSILVFDTMQVCIDPFWDKSSFVASIEYAKPVLILNRFVTCRTQTGFVPAPKPALCRP